MYGRLCGNVGCVGVMVIVFVEGLMVIGCLLGFYEVGGF